MAPDGTIYVVDDDDDVRNSLARLLAAAGYKVASFSSALEFLDALPSLAPGCLITDVRMPEMDGIALLNRMKTTGLNFPVILVTGFGDIPMAVKAMRLGASDFVKKPYTRDSIIAAVSRAQDELTLGHPAEGAAKAAQERLALLTAREREVLERLVAGMPNKVIALDLAISPRTVEFHRARLMTKTHAGSLSELVRLAFSSGLNREFHR